MKLLSEKYVNNKTLQIVSDPSPILHFYIYCLAGCIDNYKWFVSNALPSVMCKVNTAHHGSKRELILDTKKWTSVGEGGKRHVLLMATDTNVIVNLRFSVSSSMILNTTSLESHLKIHSLFGSHNEFGCSF